MFHLLWRTAAATGCAALIGLAVLAPMRAKAEDPLTSGQREAVQSEIRAYILANPDIVVEALQIMQQREQQAKIARRTAAIAGMWETLDQDPLVPVLGNPDGDVTLVEFFDYNCGYCKAVLDRVTNRIEADPDLKVVMVEFPILSESSTFAARAALAAQMQGKYAEFHFALMQSRGRLSEPVIRSIAGQVGVDWDRALKDMQSDEIDASIERNYALADALGVNGTPAFVIGDELIPGAIDEDTLANLIEEARGR